MDKIRRISIIAPMRNEAAHIDHFVADVAAQDFDGEVETIVADGGSSDGSGERLHIAAARLGVDVTVLDNPEGWVSHGLNQCIRRVSGDLIVRLDCHSRYPPDYLRRCAIAAEETGADAVGGVIEARGRTAVERAVACAMATPFGGIGFYRVFDAGGSLPARLKAAFGFPGARPTSGDGRVESDTFTFGAFRPRAFERAGLFDESLRRNQDDEFNLRLRAAGGRVMLDPWIRVYYTPRGSYGAVFRQYHEYGLWKVPVWIKHRQLPSPRSLVPLVFLGSLAALAPLGGRSPAARRLLAAELLSYGGLAVASAALSVRRGGEAWRLVPRVVLVFPAFHFGYATGMLRSGLHSALRR